MKKTKAKAKSKTEGSSQFESFFKPEEPTEVQTENLVTDWFESHPDFESARRTLPITNESRHYTDFTWPCSTDYLNPMNACFALQILNLEVLNKRPKWLIRDGLVPLLWFFKTHPKPKNLKSKIYVDEQFGAFVPEAWRSHCGTYKFKSLAKGNGSRKLLLVGIMSEAYFNLNDLDTFLDKITAETTKEELYSLQKFAMLPVKGYGFRAELDHNYHVDYMAKVCDHFGCNIKGLTIDQFRSMESFHGYEVVSLNSKFLISDSWLFHFPLSRGAKVFGQRTVTETEHKELTPFSPYHGVLLTEEIAEDSIESSLKKSLNLTTEYHELFTKAMNSETNLRMPWPRWFTDWAKAHQPPPQQG